jgi:hypothetical protein
MIGLYPSRIGRSVLSKNISRRTATIPVRGNPSRAWRSSTTPSSDFSANGPSRISARLPHRPSERPPNIAGRNSSVGTLGESPSRMLGIPMALPTR